MKGTYDISVDTPKRHRRGTLALDVHGDALHARLEAGDLGVIEAEGTRSDKDIDFTGSCEVPGVGTVEYHWTGRIWGNSLDSVAETSEGKVDIFGTRTSASLGDFGSGSGMWAGRWSDAD